MESGLSDHVWSIEEMCSLLPENRKIGAEIDKGLILKALGEQFSMNVKHVVLGIVFLMFLYFVFDPASYKVITETGFFKWLNLPVWLYRMVSSVGLAIALVLLWKSF